MNQETQVGSLKWDLFCFGAPHCANSRKQNGEQMERGNINGHRLKECKLSI